MNLNSIFSMFGGKDGFNNAVNKLGQECQQRQIDPETQVRTMLNNGTISQDAFSQAAAIADAIIGKKQF